LPTPRADTVEPFHVEITDAQVADLAARLERTRWPDQLVGTGWGLGTDSTFLRQLCDHWVGRFDWREFEARCNRHPQVRTTVDGIVVHAIVASSPRPDAAPLLLLHGWPGSVAEYFDVIEPLRHDHHVVIASLPGYGFSGPTTRRGVDQLEIARVLVELMRRLGHERFVVAGGDWGATIGAWMAAHLPAAVAGLHMTMVPMRPPERDGDLERTSGVTNAEWDALEQAQRARRSDVGYHAIQSTRPQTLAYGLTDSPTGLAGWIVEKFHAWSDCGGDIGSAFTMDRLLENVSIYWCTGTINSSMRLYLEATSGGRSLFPERPVEVPTGLAVYPEDIYPIPRAWAAQQFQIVRWEVMPRGGHFAAMEVPDLYAADVAAFTAQLGLPPTQ
jgi:epoxide hydrolase